MLNNTNKKSIMKKYFIIAAAVVAMASCTQDEIIFEENAPGNKIAFEVANYARQTKAQGENKAITNKEDSIYVFHTYAYQFPTIGDPRLFMNVDILPWNVNGTTLTQVTGENDGDYTITRWAPEEDYYWPKTGYINFYSYAANDATNLYPVESVNTAMTEVTLTYANKVIDEYSNILVADAALHYGRDNSATATHKVDDSETSGHVTKGVPTLFHHQLAKILVDVEARTTSDKVSANTTWKLKVLSVNGTGASEIKSEIVPINKGSLVLKVNDTADSYPTTKAWTATNEGATVVSGWAPSTTATDIEHIGLADSDTLTIAKGTTGDSVKDTVLYARSVMPQLTENVGFTLVYMVQAFHDADLETKVPFMEEIRTVGIETPAAIGDLASTVESWQANKKITYHIIIDPVSEMVTFDPAVEAYDEIDADGNADDININEGGIVVPQP